MNIIDEQIKEGLDKAYKKAGGGAYFGNGFNAGVAFVQELIKKPNIGLGNLMPTTYETGDWDGKRSDFVVVKTDRDEYLIARLYSGFMDGSSFNDWYTGDDYTVQGNVVGWSELPEGL